MDFLQKQNQHPPNPCPKKGHTKDIACKSEISGFCQGRSKSLVKNHREINICCRVLGLETLGVRFASCFLSVFAMAAPELDVAMRRRLQTYVHIYDFLTDTVWEDLLNAEIPRRDKIVSLVTHSAKLGLHNASEPTFGMLCALCHWTTWKADSQAPLTNADFQSVKQEIRTALETCVSKGVCGPWLQQLPSEREVFSDLDDLVPCKVPTVELWQFYEKIPLRKNRITEGGTLQAVHALEGLFAPSSGAGEANMVPAPSPSSALACLPPRAARFQIPPMSMLQPGSCLKTDGPMPEAPLEALPQNGCHSAPQSSVLQSVPVDVVNGALPGFQAHSKNAPKRLLAICDSPRVPADTPAGPEGVKGSPSRSDTVFKRPAAKPKAKVSGKAKPAAQVNTVKKRPAAKKSATAAKKSAKFDFPKGEISLHQRRLLKPMGCSRCRHSVGCSPSCWARAGYKALSY